MPCFNFRAKQHSRSGRSIGRCFPRNSWNASITNLPKTKTSDAQTALSKHLETIRNARNTITACRCHKGAPEDAANPLSKALPSQTPAATAGLDLGHRHLGTAESWLYSFLRMKLPCLLIMLVFGAAWYITYNRQCYRDMRYFYNYATVICPFLVFICEFPDWSTVLT